MKTWFKMQASPKNSGELTIDIYDEIGLWGISATDFINELNQHKDVEAVTLNLNSPGGSLFDGVAIANRIKRMKAEVTAVVDGMAASVASVIAVSADKLVMPSNAFLMIHNPANFVGWAEADDLRDMADTLDKFRDSIVTTYANKSGLQHDELIEMMNSETWLNGEEAVQMGFADEVTDEVSIAACANAVRMFKNAPDAFRNSFADIDPEEEQEEELPTEEEQTEEPEEQTEVTEEAALSDNDVDRIANRVAELMAASNKAEEQQDPEAEKTEIKVREICNVLGIEEHADSLVNQKLTVEQARSKAFELAAQKEEPISSASVVNRGTSPMVSAVNRNFNK